MKMILKQPLPPGTDRQLLRSPRPSLQLSDKINGSVKMSLSILTAKLCFKTDVEETLKKTLKT